MFDCVIYIHQTFCSVSELNFTTCLLHSSHHLCQEWWRMCGGLGVGESKQDWECGGLPLQRLRQWGKWGWMECFVQSSEKIRAHPCTILGLEMCLSPNQRSSPEWHLRPLCRIVEWIRFPAGDWDLKEKVKIDSCIFARWNFFSLIVTMNERTRWHLVRRWVLMSQRNCHYSISVLHIIVIRLVFKTCWDDYLNWHHEIKSSNEP